MVSRWQRRTQVAAAECPPKQSSAPNLKFQEYRIMQPLDLTRRDLLRAAGAIALAYPFPCLIEGTLMGADSPSKTQNDNLALRFAKYYKPVTIETRPSIPSYDLPLDLDKVANFKDVARPLNLNADEPSLKKNGFTVLPGNGNEDVVEPYKHLRKLGVPLFITADTLLHLYHVQFDETLKDIEEREFYKDVVALTEAMLAEARDMKADDADWQAAHTKVLTFFAIGLKALKPDAPTPVGVAEKDVDEVLEKMKAHAGFWPDPNEQPCPWMLFRYSEDFSQYIPRGHYTRSETLKKYFVGMMWFGRLTFLLKGASSFGPRGEALVSPEEAKRQTMAGAIVTSLLDRAKLGDGRKAYDVWERIYVVTSFYVGLADDLGFAEYKAALTKVCGAAMDATALADEKKFFALKLELAKHNPPAIYSGTGAQVATNVSAAELVKALDKSMGFRFMGQRFIPDSYMMGKLVFPTVGRPTRDRMFTRVETAGGPIRGFPRGLDVMTMLGSDRARALLTELGDDAYTGDGKTVFSYDDALTRLKKEYAVLTDADWNRNLYWSWLYALKPLLADYGKGYQSFMATTAYRTKSLNTALASWAQLRHDTILYAKQSYTITLESAPPPEKPVQGYVEPLSEFYARLLALSRMTSKGLGEMNVLNNAAKQRLASFETILERLLAIVEKELADKPLTDQDYQYIKDFGEQLERVVVPPTPKGESQAMKTTLAADVHTDQNTKEVLEEATGYVDLGVFVYRQPDGRLVIGAGPVLSYYEFKHPMSDRLTDEKWRELLKGDNKPSQPEWTKQYLSAKATYTCPPQKE
jgi:hypothetical protein